MITSDKQYHAAKEQMAMLKQSFSAPIKKDVPSVVTHAAVAELKELIAELNTRIEEYQALINNKKNVQIEIHSLEDLFAAPIRYRLANHMSVEVFGRKVGVSARQIARYEKEEYQNINTRTLQKILKELHVHIDGKIV